MDLSLSDVWVRNIRVSCQYHGAGQVVRRIRSPDNNVTANQRPGWGQIDQSEASDPRVLSLRCLARNGDWQMTLAPI